MFRIASGPGRRSVVAVVLAMLLLCTPTVDSQNVTESSLKAAFIYNFAKFTDWPREALPTTATFTACVLGDDLIRDQLDRTLQGRQLSGRGISVSEVRLEGRLRSCHLLYVSGVTSAQVVAIVAAVRGAPVLTINLEVARSSGLQLSSKLLALAAHVQ